ncbi:MAG: serine/threonine-protein kinase [Bryobacteraceae bacterium]
MTPKRWSRIKELFFAARERRLQDRRAYLDSVCGDDRDLIGEVELLLAKDQESSLRRSSVEILDCLVAELAPGHMLAQYRVEAKLGEGGMGTVYRAYDTRLRREVALKVLRADRLADANSKQRLIREARAASALNHPNIVTVHEIGTDSGVDFLAMEFVEGKSLKETIPAAGLPPAKSLDYAMQIATGLGKAHGAGIIHRDLKPANIMVTSDGG